MLCPYKRAVDSNKLGKEHYIDCIGISCSWFVSTNKCGLTMCSSIKRFDRGGYYDSIQSDDSSESENQEE